MINIKHSNLLDILNSKAQLDSMTDVISKILKSNYNEFILEVIIDEHVNSHLNEQYLTSITAVDIIFLPFIKNIFMYNMALQQAGANSLNHLGKLNLIAANAGSSLINQIKHFPFAAKHAVDLIGLSNLLFLVSSYLRCSPSAVVEEINIDVFSYLGQGEGLESFSVWIGESYSNNTPHVTEAEYSSRIWHSLLYVEPKSLIYMLLPQNSEEPHSLEAMKLACNSLSRALERDLSLGKSMIKADFHDLLDVAINNFISHVQRNLTDLSLSDEIFRLLDGVSVELYERFVIGYSSKFALDGMPYLFNKEQMLKRPDFALVLFKSLIEEDSEHAAHIELYLLENGMNRLKLCAQYPNLIDYRYDQVDMDLHDMQFFIEHLHTAIAIEPNEPPEDKLTKYAQRYFELKNKLSKNGYIVTSNAIAKIIEDIKVTAKLYINGQIRSNGSFEPQSLQKLFILYDSKFPWLQEFVSAMVKAIEIQGLHEEVLKELMLEEINSIQNVKADGDKDKFTPY